jgi:hypothetical protein
MEMALIGKACREGGLRDGFAGLQQAAGYAYPVSDLKGVGGQAGSLAEEAYEAELADAGGGRELVEPHVALGVVGEVVEGDDEPALVTLEPRRR